MISETTAVPPCACALPSWLAAALCRRGARHVVHSNIGRTGVPVPGPFSSCSLRQPASIQGARFPGQLISQDPWMGGLTSCSSTTSLACYSDRPGPPPLLIGATAAAALFRRHCSWGICSCVAHGQPAPSQAPPRGLFQAHSGPTWRCLAITHGLLGGLPPNLSNPQCPLGS